jgi:hypothetical protein
MYLPLSQEPGLGKGVESSASLASVERALFGDPNHSHSNQGGRDHPMDPPHPSEECNSWVEETTGLQQSAQTDPEEGTFNLALVTNWKLTSLCMAEAWGVNWTDS